MILVGGINSTMETPAKMINGTEVTCVATLYRGIVYVIPAPAEHRDVMDYIEQHLVEDLDGSQVHGFLTDKDEFITIAQGIELARKHGKLSYDSPF